MSEADQVALAHAVIALLGALAMAISIWNHSRLEALHNKVDRIPSPDQDLKDTDHPTSDQVSDGHDEAH